ncbi:MAG: VOC family protein [Hyphomicrobiaceae bacterium]|nr:VOC family protein [Hyphomicrobiaceae bacterium]
MGERGFAVRALGEIAIRVRDMDAMVAFYRDIIGLEILSRRNNNAIVFFRIADGYAGHTAVLALFQDETDVATRPGWADRDASETSLHHFALTVAREEQDAAIRWYEEHDVDCRIQEFGCGSAGAVSLCVIRKAIRSSSWPTTAMFSKAE